MWPGGPSSHKLGPPGKFVSVGPACSLFPQLGVSHAGAGSGGRTAEGATAHPPPPYQVRKRDGHEEDGLGGKETLGPGAKLLFGEKGKNERNACT